jgi:uncharacterized membrane protein
MKKIFITGLVTLLPLALTLLVLLFVFNLLTGPFVEVMNSILDYYGVIGVKYWQYPVSRLIILGLLIAFTILLGAFGRWYFVHSFIKFWENLVYQIPFVSSIYKTCKDVMSTIMATETRSFKQVVVVPFPSEDVQSVGLVTQENIRSSDGEEMLAVFVPTTPNPTSGFLMMFKEHDLVHIDMSVEEAFRYIISCGVIPSPFREVK